MHSSGEIQGESNSDHGNLLLLMTSVGVGLGVAVSSWYDRSSSAALSMEGTFDAAASGFLINMALADLLAVDFTSTRMQTNLRLQLEAHFALLGAGALSVLVIWAYNWNINANFAYSIL